MSLLYSIYRLCLFLENYLTRLCLCYLLISVIKKLFVFCSCLIFLFRNLSTVFFLLYLGVDFSMAFWIPFSRISMPLSISLLFKFCWAERFILIVEFRKFLKICQLVLSKLYLWISWFSLKSIDFVFSILMSAISPLWSLSKCTIGTCISLTLFVIVSLWSKRIKSK